MGVFVISAFTAVKHVLMNILWVKHFFYGQCYFLQQILGSSEGLSRVKAKLLTW